MAGPLVKPPNYTALGRTIAAQAAHDRRRNAVAPEGLTMMKYPGNLLNEFENGCSMDLRLKLAIEFLKAGIAPNYLPDGTHSTELQARAALDLSEALLAEAEKRGLVAPLPDHSDLPPNLLRQIERNIAAQVYQQMEGQRAAQNAASGIVVARPVMGH